MPTLALEIKANVEGNTAGILFPSTTVFSDSRVYEAGVYEHGVYSESEGQFLILYGNVDTAVSTQLRPGANPGTVQRPGIRFSLAGAKFPLQEMAGSWRVGLSLDQPRQGWSFSAHVRNGVLPFGSVFANRGPGMAKKSVNVEGVYLGSNGTLYAYPLITDGIIDSESIEGGGSFLSSVNGVDRGGRFQGTPTTLVIPPGHGLRDDVVVKRLLEEQGFSAFRLIPGQPMYGEVQVVDGDGFAVGSEIMAAKGRALLIDVDGNVVNPILGPPDRAAGMTFTEQDILALSTFTVQPPAHPPTDITLLGKQTVPVDEDPDESAGLKSKTYRVEVKAIYAPIVAGFTQGTTCTLTATSGATPATAEITVALTVTTLEYRNDVLIHEVTKTWGYYNPVGTRYTYTAGVKDCLGSGTTVYVDAGASASDSSSARQFRNEQWMLVAKQEAWHFYDLIENDESGSQFNYWQHGPRTLLDLSTPFYSDFTVSKHLQGTSVLADAGTGFKLGTITEISGYYFPRVRLKRKVDIPAGESWNATNPPNNTATLGNGEAVHTNIVPLGNAQFETFRVIAREAVLYEADEDGFVDAETRIKQAFHLPPGDAYFYSDGTESSSAEETLTTIQREITTYLPIEEGTTRSVTVRTGYNGMPPINEPTQESRDIDGGRPAVDRITRETIDEDLYDNAEEAELARKFAASDSRQITVQVIADDLERIHPKREIKTSLTYAESIAELTRAAELMFDEAAAIHVSFVVPVCYPLARMLYDRVPVRVKMRQLGVDHDVAIRSLEFSGGAGQPALTRITGSIYA